ncbi:MAG: AI-2E family transporter [Candidatus Paceibacterota bacterium]
MNREEKELHISVTVGTIVKCLVVLAVVYFLYLVRDLVLVVLMAIVIASAIEPGTKWLMNRKIPRTLAVILIYAFTAIILGVVVFFVIPPLINQIVEALNKIPEYAQSLKLVNPLGINTGGINQFISIQDIISSASSSLMGFTSGASSLVAVIFGGILNLLLVFVFSFYLAVQEEGVANFLRVITPLKHEKYIISLWKRSQIKIGFWLQGQLLLGLIIGILVYLGLSVLGVEHALLLAVIAAIFELIPIFGPIIGSIPSIAVGLSSGGITMGLLVAGLYTIVQQFESQLIYPLVVKKIVGVPALLVIVAIVAGAQLAGLFGAILSVPLAAVFMELYTDMEKNKISEIEKMSTIV